VVVELLVVKEHQVVEVLLVVKEHQVVVELLVVKEHQVVVELLVEEVCLVEEVLKVVLFEKFLFPFPFLLFLLKLRRFLLIQKD